ncbi:MAG: hypothetical protein WAX29_10655 [Propionibacterium sp.]
MKVVVLAVSVAVPGRPFRVSDIALTCQNATHSIFASRVGMDEDARQVMDVEPVPVDPQPLERAPNPAG